MTKKDAWVRLHALRQRGQMKVLSSILWATALAGGSFLFWVLTGAPAGEVLVGTLIVFGGFLLADYIRMRRARHDPQRVGPADVSG